MFKWWKSAFASKRKRQEDEYLERMLGSREAASKLLGILPSLREDELKERIVNYYALGPSYHAKLTIVCAEYAARRTAILLRHENDRATFTRDDLIPEDETEAQTIDRIDRELAGEIPPDERV